VGTPANSGSSVGRDVSTLKHASKDVLAIGAGLPPIGNLEESNGGSGKSLEWSHVQWCCKFFSQGASEGVNPRFNSLPIWKATYKGTELQHRNGKPSLRKGTEGVRPNPKK